MPPTLIPALLLASTFHLLYTFPKVAFFDSVELGSDLEAKVMWAADIALQLTAACSFVMFSDGQVLAR